MLKTFFAAALFFLALPALADDQNVVGELNCEFVSRQKLNVHEPISAQTTLTEKQLSHEQFYVPITMSTGGGLPSADLDMRTKANGEPVRLLLTYRDNTMSAEIRIRTTAAFVANADFVNGIGPILQYNRVTYAFSCKRAH